MADIVETTPKPVAAWVRPAVGFGQGLALYVLTDQMRRDPGFSMESWLMAVAAVALFVPVVFIAGLGAVRGRTLAIWTALAALLAGAFVAYGALTRGRTEVEGQHLPLVFVGTGLVLFIAHHLVVPGDQERRWRASYRRIFDIAATNVARLALSAAFVGAFWALLGLGATLFGLIGLKAVGEVISKGWFAMPATATAFAAAVQLTDIRSGLVRNVRALALTLLSWLLPLTTLIVASFIVSMMFTGLALLWATKSAAAILLAAAAALIVLLNAAHQDGVQESAPRVLRWSGRLAALLVAPLGVIAAYALALRIGQYGLTPDRVVAAACVVVCLAFAVGYLLAALSRAAYAKRLETTNIAAAHLSVVVVAALLSPLADPRRLSVSDQLRRLDHGQVSPADFDYAFLKFRAGRRGEAALQALAARRTGPHAQEIAERAGRALAMPTPYMPPPPTASEREQLAAAIGRGRLPPSFVDQEWGAAPDPLASCAPREVAARPGSRCAAVVGDLDGDGGDEVLWFQWRTVTVFKQVDGRWTSIAHSYSALCDGELDAVVQGRAEIKPPKTHWNELEIAGRRVRVAPDEPCKTDKPADGRVVDMKIAMPGARPKAEP